MTAAEREYYFGTDGRDEALRVVRVGAEVWNKWIRQLEENTYEPKFDAWPMQRASEASMFHSPEGIS